VAQRRLRARFIAGLAGPVVALAIGGGVALAADHAVAISGSSFSPANVTVTVGDTVTWTNSDQLSHTATADAGAFDTGALGNGQSGSATFATAGSFPYHCSIHPDMTGTITVAAAAEPTAGPTNPPTDTVAVTPTDASAGVLGAALVIGGTWLIGFFIARRRMAR